MTLFDLARAVPFRGKVRLLDRFCPQEGVTIATVFGYEVALDLHNFIDRMIYLGCYEPLNTYRFRQILFPGATIIDVGANIGYFSLLSARLAGGNGRIFALEPHQTSFDLLRHTVAENHLTQIRPHRLALGREAGTGVVSMADDTVFPNRTASMAAHEAQVPGDGATTCEVQIRTLDEVLHTWDLPCVDLLKIDVDGFETAIIEGAVTSLRAGKVRNLIIEFHASWLESTGSSVLNLASLIEATGMVDCSSEYGLAQTFLGPSEDRLYRRLS